MEVEGRKVDGAWVRHVPHGADLLGRAVPPADGRWQRGEVVGGLYLADGAETATAEWYRALAEQGFRPREAPSAHATSRYRSATRWPPIPNGEVCRFSEGARCEHLHAYPDYLAGGEGPDVIHGNGGFEADSATSDFLDGGNGDDILAGSDGYEYLLGGAGDDSLAGGANDDVLDGISSATTSPWVFRSSG